MGGSSRLVTQTKNFMALMVSRGNKKPRFGSNVSVEEFEGGEGGGERVAEGVSIIWTCMSGGVGVKAENWRS
jgi:hypothetical protein